MRFILASFFLLLSLPTMAAEVESLPAKVKQESSRNWSLLAVIGGDYRAEETSEGYLEGQNYMNYALGFGYKPMLFVLESSTATKTTGNNTLNVETTYTDYMLWTYYRPAEIRIFPAFAVEAFMGGGLGIYKLDVDTTLSGTTTSNSSDGKLTGGLAVGLRPVIDPIWLSIEVRVRAGEDFKPNPSLSGLARIGLHF